MNNVFISLGSNIGNRLEHLKDAIQAIHTHEHMNVSLVSSIYETEPVGFSEQSNFLNLVVQIETDLDPQALLKQTQSIESRLGRVRKIRWGPRTIDLDILLYNNDNIEAENLIIPHLRMSERGFVLVPLLEIAPEITSPTGKRYADEEAVHQEGIVLWKQINNVDELLAIEE